MCLQSTVLYLFELCIVSECSFLSASVPNCAFISFEWHFCELLPHNTIGIFSFKKAKMSERLSEIHTHTSYYECRFLFHRFAALQQSVFGLSIAFLSFFSKKNSLPLVLPVFRISFSCATEMFRFSPLLFIVFDNVDYNLFPVFRFGYIFHSLFFISFSVHSHFWSNDEGELPENGEIYHI